MATTVDKLLDTARGFLGYSEDNGKHKEILKIYNDHKPLARGYKMKPTDSWCDCFVSAVAIKANAVDIIGTEVGCERHIQIFKDKGIWIEDGSKTPKKGDIIVYNWDDKTQPNDGFADHIGIVEEVKDGYITVIEGNKSNKVGRRFIPIGWGYIRGFARPKYKEVKIVKKKITPTMVIIEYGVAEGAEKPLGGELSKHTTEVYTIVKNNQKFDFKIVSIPDVGNAYKWIERNKDDIFVITASVESFYQMFMFNKFKKDIYMAAAAGNYGDKGEGYLATLDYFTAIGAIDNKFVLEPYSSYGKGAVEFVGMIPRKRTKYTFNGTNYNKRLTGTSFACPEHSTQIMNLMVDYYNRTGERLPMEEVLRIRNKYVKDVLDTGKDLKSGYGYYKYGAEQLNAELDYMELKKQVKELKELNKVYNTIEEVPSWARPTIKKLVNRGSLSGDDKGHLNLNLNLIRELLINDNEGLYK